MPDLVSLETEKNCISGLLQFPNLISNLPSEINPDDFSLEVHKVIFSVIRNIVLNGETFDRRLIGEKIRNIGFMVKEDFNIYEYIEALSLIQINENAVLSYFQDLKKYSICRGLDETATVIREALRHNLNLSTSEIIRQVDGIYNRKLDSYNYKVDESVNIYEIMEQTLMESALNPTEEIGLSSPFSIFNRYFGGFRNGDVYTICSRAGVGKSTWLNYVANQILLNDPKVKVLYLDTEMNSRDALLRMAAAVMGVPFYYLDTGLWIKNKEMYSKVIEGLKFVKEKSKNRFFHRYVANVPIDDIISIIRNWFFINCERFGKDIKPLVVYDYMKISGEKTSAGQQEHQVIGEKLNKAKETCMRIGAPLLTAVQMNRLGVTSNKKNEETTDDSSVIALSDRIIQFSSYVGIFRHKSFEEMARDGDKCGTHLLKTLKARFQGKESSGHSDWVKIDQGKEKPIYMQNYINYIVDNFNVKETISLRDLVTKQKFQKDSVEVEDSRIF